MRSNRKRGWLVPLAALALVAGCTPTPAGQPTVDLGTPTASATATATPTPTASADEAAALALLDDYYAARDRFIQEDAALSELYPVATQKQVEQLVGYANSLAGAGAIVSGSTKVVRAEVGEIAEADGAKTVDVESCIDSSQVKIVNADGKDLRTDSGENNRPLVFHVVWEDGQPKVDSIEEGALRCGD